jgi:predicted AAA+ superfamily ATPase
MVTDMINRSLWIEKIRRAWEKRPLVWLSGVRRVGKTTLSLMIKDAVYCNCDLPSVIRRLEDPESFYESIPDKRIVIFDEVHRTYDPSRLLKIAADAYPHLRILATGSSTLAATKKFRDTLTGRKHTIFLPPVLWQECVNTFGIQDLDRRLLFGGLPEPLLAVEKDPSFFSEWTDSFYARDIQELFSIRNRTGFLNLFRLLLRQSGGLVDYSSLSKLCDLTRPTVKAHIEAMSIAHAVFLLPPFHGGGRREITQRPKVYAFDTGFVTFMKGWDTIREEDRGILWEHLVLDALRTSVPAGYLYYWRDKSNREVDFVIRSMDNTIHAIECKINPDQFNHKSIRIFRTLYPSGNNIVISPRVKSAYQRSYEDLMVQYHSLESWVSSFKY